MLTEVYYLILPDASPNDLACPAAYKQVQSSGCWKLSDTEERLR